MPQNKHPSDPWLIEAPFEADLAELPDEPENTGSPPRYKTQSNWNERLKHAIRESGLGNHLFPRYMGFASTSWADWKKGKEPRGAEKTLLGVSCALSVSPQWLLQGDDRAQTGIPFGRARLWEANLLRFISEQGGTYQLLEWMSREKGWDNWEDLVKREAEHKAQLDKWRGRRLRRARLAMSKRAGLKGLLGTGTEISATALTEVLVLPNKKVASLEAGQAKFDRSLFWALEATLGLGHRWLMTGTGTMWVNQERIGLGDVSSGPRFGWTTFPCREQERALLERLRVEGDDRNHLLESLLLAQRRAAIKRGDRNRISEEDLEQRGRVKLPAHAELSDVFRDIAKDIEKRRERSPYASDPKPETCLHISEVLCRSSLEVLALRKRQGYFLVAQPPTGREQYWLIHRLSLKWRNRAAGFGTRGREFTEQFPD